jgi:hypothetical protein
MAALMERFPDLQSGCEIQESASTDYSFRIFTSKPAWAKTMAALAEETDYDNFKSEVARHQGRAGAGCLLPVASERGVCRPLPPPDREAGSQATFAAGQRQTNTWACGIVRTIGWVNFLDDRSQKPHMKLTAVDKALGVGESTGQGWSMLIRNMLKIRPMDLAWSLRSRMHQNPMAWMIQVNGFLLDARFLKREIQEKALRKGLIPYIPERMLPTKEDADEVE